MSTEVAGPPERGPAGRAQALDALRRAIRAGDLAPGCRLVEAESADTCGHLPAHRPYPSRTLPSRASLEIRS